MLNYSIKICIILKTAIVIVQKCHQDVIMMFLCIQNKVNWTLTGMVKQAKVIVEVDCEIGEAQLSSSSSLSSVSFDDKREDVELVILRKKWALKHNSTRQCANDILAIFIELGYAAPEDCRTLLNTMKEVDIQPMGEASYVYIGIEKLYKSYTAT